PAYENKEFVKAIQEIKDLRHERGLIRERTWIKYVGLEEALRQADFVSIHVPLIRPGESSEPTWHLINDATLRLMKPTAYRINISRGPVVDELAVARAIKQNRIAGAALDVFEKEPLPAD